jgi:hypothetical protein
MPGVVVTIVAFRSASGISAGGIDTLRSIDDLFDAAPKLAAQKIGRKRKDARIARSVERLQ